MNIKFDKISVVRLGFRTPCECQNKSSVQSCFYLPLQESSKHIEKQTKANMS